MKDRTDQGRTGWRYVATMNGKAMSLEHPSWEEARDHVEYLHRAWRWHGHIFGITKFYRRSWS